MLYFMVQLNDTACHLTMLYTHTLGVTYEMCQLDHLPPCTETMVMDLAGFLNHVQIFHTCIMTFPSITAGLQG
uniref:Uncharacterized protein n=1 Tax=Anguilla anguilla TaxID=7936 RepID=A0A0E9SP28_ANGAN